MSEFFSDLGKAVQRVTGNIGAEISVAAQEQRIKDAYQELGRLYFESVQAGQTPDEAALSAQVDRICQLKQQIEEIRSKQDVAAE